jgi:hypothetical protein
MKRVANGRSMRNVFLVAVLASASATSSLSRSAHAQTPEDTDTKQARARFLEGVDAYDKGNYELARSSFKQAYALKRHPAVLLNWALSCEKSNHPLEAAKHFQAFIRDSSNLTADKRAEAEKGLANARTKLGRLDILAPQGSEVSVDNERVGTAPLTDAVDVEPGSHTVTAKTSEGQLENRTSAVAAGQKLKVTLAKEPKVEPRVESKPDPAPPTPEAKPLQQDVAITDPLQPPTPLKPAASGTSALSPPKSMVPVYVGLGVGAVGLASTIIFAVSKSNAQDAANTVELKIRDAANRESRSPIGICTTPPSNFVGPCKTLRDNRDAVDTDATLANLSAVVMASGFLFAGGWYLLAPKRQESASASAASFVRGVQIAPIVSPRSGGLTLSGAF